MATIALYASQINQMPGLIGDIKGKVMDFQSELSALRTNSQQVNQSICDLSGVVSSIQASSQTQDQKLVSLDALNQNLEQFVESAAHIDKEVADTVRQRKDDFYEKYNYLKPACEKSGWEKFCDGCAKAGEWCKEHWQSICKILVAVVIVVALGVASVLTGGALAVILAGAFWGALLGGVLGGITSGIASAMSGGSFFDGFADGAFSGALTGAITGAACAGIGVAGAALGRGIQCASTLGKVINVTSKVTRVLSLGLDGFDMLALGVGLFDPANPLVEFNTKLHSSALYNGFQISVNALAIFTGAASSTMKCFVAGTMILTAAGLVAIENIKAGDKVIATNVDTFETAEKTVLETYIRETTELVNLTINGELIRTTADHPFYVKDEGFLPAGKLYIGDKLLDSKGNVLIVEDFKIEYTDNPVLVYNFQVEDFHTYHVGNNCVLVHNAEYTSHGRQRARERGFSDSKVDNIMKNPSQKVYQSGGQTVYAQKNNGYYDVIITNRSNEVVTCVGGNKKSLPNWKAVTEMLKNNGGYSSLPF